MSSTLKSTGVGYFEAKCGRHGAVDILCRLSTMHKSDRQRDRLRNGNIDRNKRNRLSVMSPNNKTKVLGCR